MRKSRKMLAVTAAIIAYAVALVADFRRTNLRMTLLDYADLRGADFRGSDLRQAFLYDADLRGADFRGTDLSSANLHWADLRGADFRETNLKPLRVIGARYDDNTRWPVGFSPAAGEAVKISSKAVCDRAAQARANLEELRRAQSVEGSD